MPRRLLKLISGGGRQSARAPVHVFSTQDIVWAMGSFCALNRKPFDAELLVKQFPPPYSSDSLIHAARALGFRIKRHDCDSRALANFNFPCLAVLNQEGSANLAGNIDPRSGRPEPVEGAPHDGETSTGGPPAGDVERHAATDSSLRQTQGDRPEDQAVGNDAQSSGNSPPAIARPAILVQMDDKQVVLFEAGSNTPKTLAHDEFAARFAGTAFQLALEQKPIQDPDGAAAAQQKFGFRWFIPELLKHKKIWRDVLIASLVIQLLALATPLFTQVIIDKVVVHHTQSTLIVIGIGLAVFMVFSALLSWVRQYLVLHTGNRVDAVLGAAVFDHMFKLPTRYYEHRSTGVITARLHGVETIREFIASTAVTLVLDLPFLFIFLGIMLYYSVLLTCVALSIIAVIVVMSLIVAPLFRKELNDQFLLGARNQAFTTEYVAGIETVKSLQMEPQLKARYSDYLAEYLHSGFKVRQIGNTYKTISNGLEQLMTLLILIIGAYIVMNSDSTSEKAFTIGMLIAFQMFAGRISQPMLRIVGLWQQFQQASMSVQRLGDLMNAPPEPYSVIPSRLREGKGEIVIEHLAFRYAEDRPFLYEDFNLKVPHGKVVAIMGPSGSGKSTLTKLLQGFYQPSSGTIRIDNTDIRYLSANELRHYFGVVPQETMLFSGTIYDNLLMANPHATFEQIVQCCKMAEIHPAIEQLPQGYQTEIGERGAGLSGGQKQRLSIARALLKQPKVLVFDEATSSLDSNTAEHFAATINQLKGKVSMLFITHAMPKALQVDEIVRIGQGSLSAVSDTSDKPQQKEATMREAEGGAHG
jgi:ATP-binding cassette, subfamily B, bacterial HlyB/CyaB